MVSSAGLLVLAACAALSLTLSAEAAIAAAALAKPAVHAAKGRSQNGYCGLCRDHTMCRYYGQRQGCSSRPLDQAERDEVLAAHNTLRSALAAGREARGAPGPQPPAANMKYMWYDEELATVAQRWADQCTFEHDTCRDVERFAVGQNLFQERSTAPLKRPDWHAVTNKWFDEVALHSGRQSLGPYRFLSATGHFTQVGWADTFLVGCAVAESLVHQDGRRWNSRIFVCNYGPAGNVQGRSMYQSGPACSQCAAGSSCYYGLCY